MYFSQVKGKYILISLQKPVQKIMKKDDVLYNCILLLISIRDIFTTFLI